MRKEIYTCDICEKELDIFANNEQPIKGTLVFQACREENKYYKRFAYDLCPDCSSFIQEGIDELINKIERKE